MFSTLEEMKISVEQALPPDVVAALREADVALTLVPQQAPNQALVDISDELAERELLGDIVNYRKDVTGVDNTIFISQKAFARHAARIKVAVEPPDSIEVTSKTASVAISTGDVVGGKIPAKVLKQVQKFVELNRDALNEYWNARITTNVLEKRLKAVKD